MGRDVWVRYPVPDADTADGYRTRQGYYTTEILDVNSQTRCISRIDWKDTLRNPPGQLPGCVEIRCCAGFPDAMTALRRIA